MSVLETPRLMFRGCVSWDPIVTNNLPAQYDENQSKTVFGSSADDVISFRQAAIAAVGGGNWNPHGTHRSRFYDTSIVAVDKGRGPTRADAAVNSPVSFTGMLVDLEPYGMFSSQLFFDEMSFGIEGGCRVFAPRKIRMTARYLNRGRNTKYPVLAGGASVVWQTSFPKADGLRVDPHDSTALRHIAKALEADDVLGLTVRWCAYLTIYFDSTDPNAIGALAQQLQGKLQCGGFQPNPARSRLVGVLGLWRHGEPASEAGDRALLTRQPKRMASAHARLSHDRVTFDLANSIPETDTDLTKSDLGELTAVTVAPDGETVIDTLGSFGYEAYCRERYDATAGIVTIKVDPKAARKACTADIQLRQSDGSVLLAEAALRAVPMAPNIYLDEGEKTDLSVLVLDRGRRARSGLAVTMADPNTASAASITTTTNAHGIATFPLTGTVGQVEGFVFLPGRGQHLPQVIDPQTTTYAYVRTLPADPDIAALPPTWQNVHGRVLRNWQAMAPCMDNWLNLGDPEQVRSFAALLHRLTARSNFESFRFMPVTRDMTAGERSLLYAFLDGAQASQTVQVSPQGRAARRSRSMRQG